MSTKPKIKSHQPKKKLNLRSGTSKIDNLYWFLTKYFQVSTQKIEDNWNQLSAFIIQPTTFSNEKAAVVESDRIPGVFFWPNFFVHNTKDLVKQVISPQEFDTKEMKTIVGQSVKLKDVLSGAYAEKRTPVSIVEDLYFEKDSKLGKVVAQWSDWNALWENELGYELTSNTLVLSDPRAHSKSHQHPLMFWNFAVEGKKFYVLFDATTLKKTPKRGIKTNKVSLKQFIALAKQNKARIAILDSKEENEQGRLLVVPSRYSHEVFTDTGYSSKVYGGLVGFAVPRNTIGWNTLQKSLVERNKDMQHSLGDDQTAINKLKRAFKDTDKIETDEEEEETETDEEEETETDEEEEETETDEEEERKGSDKKISIPSKSLPRNRYKIRHFFMTKDELNRWAKYFDWTNKHVPFQIKVAVSDDETKGKGVFSKVFIPAKSFVIEYKGERITPKEGKRRLDKQDDNASSYIFILDKIAIDASLNLEEYGMARFINHCREQDSNFIKNPHVNLRANQVKDQNRNYHVVLFSIRDIQPGEELCYDYGDRSLSWL